DQRLTEQCFAVERDGDKGGGGGNSQQEESCPEPEQIETQPPQAEMDLEGDPDTAVIQESACGGADRSTPAIAEQEDEAGAPGGDDQGRQTAQVEWPERRAQERTQENPG